MDQTIQKLSDDVAHCLRKHQFSLQKDLRAVRSELKAGSDVERAVEQLAQRIQRSVEQREARAASVPALRFPDLPVADKKTTIADAIRAHPVIIVCGETGSGKTTQLPKICLSVGRGCSGLIGHTQPRRIAARNVAARIAEELGQPAGETVGCKVRFHDQTRPESLIKLMTDGILLAEIQSDPYLDQYDTLIIDEAHERSLNIDFLLGYLKWLLPKRPDLKLIITSATIDPERFAHHYDDAPIIQVSGRTYPVEIRYRPAQGDDSDETTRDLQQSIIDAVDELHRDQPGDILVFLAGEREIRETAEVLRKHHPADTELLPLYSRLSANEQARVFKAHRNKRIVLATNVAETSLTVPGIRSVIDTGHARISRYSHRSKLQRLPIEKVSQASANQRSGRCGRLGPGVCVRLFSEEDFCARPEHTEPELLRTNLAAVVLKMKSLGLGDIDAFPYVEPPDHRMIRDGLKMLQELNAVDQHQQLTAIGRKLSRLPVDPRLGRMLLAADNEQCLSEVSIIVAALSIQDPRERPVDQVQAADQKHAQFKAEASDFMTFVHLWRYFEENKKHLTNSKLRKLCRDQFLSYLRMREWHDIHQQIMQIVKGELGMNPNPTPAGYEAIHRSLLTGLLANIGFKQDRAEYLGARNRKFFIHPASSLFKSKPKWILSSEPVETTRVYARYTAKIEPAWVEQVARHLVKKRYFEPHWERKPARAAIYEQISLFGLVLQNRRKVPYERIDPAGARELFIRSALVNQDYDCSADFFRHNQSLLESVGMIQHKGRRIDLLADETGLYQFYDERIPARVVNGVTFERWRRPMEKKQPDRLYMSRDALIRQDASSIDEKSFPDELIVNSVPLVLRYRFEPGHAEDGVTAIVPLHQLNQLSSEPFEWLVPGMLREKLIAMIKSLPKTLRRRFVPAPDYAGRCMEYMPYREGSLDRSLRAALQKFTQVVLPDDAWREDVLPDHLKMNFHIVDASGKTIASSRHLPDLQGRFEQQAGQAFHQFAAEVVLCTGCSQWDFDDVPERCELAQKGKRLNGFPALFDEGATVGVKIFDTEVDAGEHHRAGLLRLFKIALGKQLKYLKKNLPTSTADAVLYKRLPAHPFLCCKTDQKSDLEDDVINLIVAALFLDGQASIRSKTAFNGRLQTKRADLFSLSNEIGACIVSVLETYRAISDRLDKLSSQDSVAQDVSEQMAVLIYAGFVANTPYNRLKEIPRYLKAVVYRLEKSANNRGRDRQKQKQLQFFWGRYWDSFRQSGGRTAVAPERDEFRWSLEEFRVSLFAQTLKTAYPISEQRLEKAWNSRR